MSRRGLRWKGATGCPSPLRVPSIGSDPSQRQLVGTSKNPSGRAGWLEASETSGWRRKLEERPFGRLRPEPQGLARDSRWFSQIPL